jgi:hypothetical protein
MTMTSDTLRWPFVSTPRRERPRTGEAGAKAGTKEARAPRIPVTEVKHFMLSDLSPAERVKLLDDTYPIMHAYFPDDTRDSFEQDFFSGDQTWVFLYHGADGALAGFKAISLLRVSHEGKEHAVFKGVICVDARYKLVWRACLPTLVETVRWKLKNPWTPVGYAGMAASPSVYRLCASSVPRIYPSRHEETPETIKALLLKATRMRGYRSIDEDRMLVPAVSRLAHPERIEASRSLRDDPDARFFMEKNPRFDEFYMLMYVPLDLGNVAAGIAKTLGRHLFGGAPN